MYFIFFFNSQYWNYTKISPAFELCKANSWDWAKPSMSFGVLWLFGAFCTSQVAYHRSLCGCPLKMNHGFLITDWHFWQWWPFSCVTPLSHSLSLFVPPPSHRRLASLSLFPSHLLLPSLLYPSISRLTAIRHWPGSLCLLPLPQVQPSHNYFLWFTVVGHCHPPKVFTAEITHTASQPDLPPLFHYPLLCPEALVNTGLIKNPDIQREQFFLNGRGVAI